MAKQQLSDKITEKWEAYANREQVIGEHLRNLFNAQQAFSRIVAVSRFGGSTASRTGADWADFWMKMYILLTQSRIKLMKLGAGDKEFKENAGNLLRSVRERMLPPLPDNTKDVTLAEFDQTINTIGMIYDTLGYSAAERKTIHSPLLSDLNLGKFQKPEEMFESGGDDDIEASDEFPV